MVQPKIHISVDYDDVAQRFLIRCPIWANDVIRELPNRRWLKRAHAWGAPLIRRNVEFIIHKLRDPKIAEFTPAAVATLDSALTKLAEIKESGEGLPSWYKYKTEPRPHQVKCVNKWYGKKAFGCYADRGTGKTKMTIDVACARRMEDKIDALIIVCKLSGRRTWKEEWEVHAPIPAEFHFLQSSKGDAMYDFIAKRHDMPVLVVGTESLSQGRAPDLVKSFAMAHRKVMVVVDEAHDYANYKAIRTEHLFDLRNLTEYRGILTGTPISTGPLNLYAQFEFLDPDIIGIGDYYAFRNRYAVMGGYRNEKGRAMNVIGYQNIDELSTTVAPYVYECRKSEVLAHLPPKVYEQLHVELTKEQRKIYDKVRREKTYELNGSSEQTVQNCLELALRLHTICGGYITTYEDLPQLDGRVKRIPTVHEIVPWNKNPKILELLEVAADNKPMIVWCAYRPEIAAVTEALRKSFPDRKCGFIHGGYTEGERDDFRQRFQDGDITYLIGNTMTGGASLTLTACETMYYYNNTEKMIDREQSEDRAHRDGLKHSVLYIDCLAERTVDVTIFKSIQEKVNLSEYIRRNISEAARLLDGDY